MKAAWAWMCAAVALVLAEVPIGATRAPFAARVLAIAWCYVLAVACLCVSRTLVKQSDRREAPMVPGDLDADEYAH